MILIFFMEKKMTISKKATTVATVIMLIISIPFGVMVSLKYSYPKVYEVFEAQVTLSENVTFDDELTVFIHGFPITLYKGMTGNIRDMASSNGDDSGEAFIHVSFELDNGDSFDALIPAYDSAEGASGPVIKLNELESPQSTLEGYLQSRKNYHSEIRFSLISGAVLSFVVICIIAAVLKLISLNSLHENVQELVFVLTVSVSAFLIIDMILNALFFISL